MAANSAVIERDKTTGLYVGWVPGLPGAHSQAETIEQLRANLRDVLAMLAEDGPLVPVSELVGTETLR